LFLRQIQLFKEIIGGGTNPKWDLVLLGGALGSLYSFLQFAASPFIGTFSDRFGRRKTLLVTMVSAFSVRSFLIIIYIYIYIYNMLC
jgi:MFS family permease